MLDRINKTNRMLKIWILLANNPNGFTARDLAGRFEVNERTIYRDLTAMGTELNVPVYNEKIYWKIREDYFLPPIRFTLPEALNIYLASRLMLGYSHRFDPGMDATFTKLSSVMPKPLAEQVNKTLDWMRKLPRDQKYAAVLTKAAEAWVNQKQLKIVYRTLDAEQSNERVIDPYYIEPAAPGHSSYILAFCHLKQAMRMFKVERIESAEVTGTHYVIPADFDANKYFSSSWGIVAEGEVKKIKLKIVDPKMKRLMTETVWHPSQSFEKQRDGSLIMTLQVTETQELISWLLGWGGKVKVMEPESLRREIILAAKDIQALYRK